MTAKYLGVFLLSVLALSACSDAPPSLAPASGPEPSSPAAPTETKLKGPITRAAGGGGTPAPSPTPGVNFFTGDGAELYSNNLDPNSGFKALGSVTQGASTATKTYKLTNGNASGTGASITIYKVRNANSDSASSITISGLSLPLTLAPGASTNFNINLLSTQNNLYLGRIEILSNDEVGSSLADEPAPPLGYSFKLASPTNLIIITISAGLPNKTYKILEKTDLMGPWVDNGLSITTNSNGAGSVNVPAVGSQKYFKALPVQVRKFSVNLVGAVASPAGSLCAGDSNANGYWSDCSGKSNGAICGQSLKGKTKVCNQQQCILMGDLNYDEDVTLADTDLLIAELNGSPSNPAANFSCDGSFSNKTALLRGFANLAASSASNEEYNSRVRSACGSDASITRARAKVFTGDVMNWNTFQFNTPQEVCIDNLGTYDVNSSDRTGSPDSYLTGRFLFSNNTSINNPGQGLPLVSRFQSGNGDFRVNYDGSGSTPARESLLWSSEAQMYYDINRYRSIYLNDAFIEALNLPYELKMNAMYRQYRPDLNTGSGISVSPNKPTMIALENYSAYGSSIYQEANAVSVTLRTRGPYLNYASLPPLSRAFDAGETVGEYAGLVASWILGSNQGFPSSSFWGTQWQTNVLAPVNDGLNWWVAYRYTGQTEVTRYSAYALRTWAGRPCGGTGIPCSKGENIRNVMMFDEQDTSKDGVFPYSLPTGLAEFDGPVGSNLAGMYFAALFYDISKEAGLGDYKADLLFWKTLSLITSVSSLSVRQFGAKILEAAQALWGGIYDQDIIDVLTSRGIPMNGTANFRNLLPAAIGSYPATLERSSSNGFGSSHPETQPNVNSYGIFSGFYNGYTHPSTGANDYVAYQFYKHSKYGPCDKLILTNGSFNATSGAYNNDGTYYRELTDRELGNLVVLAPGNRIRWNRIRYRCANEASGFYAEDVRAFGFRVIKATKNGFSFTVSNASTNAQGRNYTLTIVDPSVTAQGPATYNWTITNALGYASYFTGNSVDISVPVDEPFTIRIDRTRGAQTDTLELRERGSDLDRLNGGAFLLNLLPAPL